jgi:hypothetical protein
MNRVLRIRPLFNAGFLVMAVPPSETTAHSTCGTAIYCHCFLTTHPVSSFDSTYVEHHIIFYKFGILTDKWTALRMLK